MYTSTVVSVELLLVDCGVVRLCRVIIVTEVIRCFEQALQSFLLNSVD